MVIIANIMKKQEAYFDHKNLESLVWHFHKFPIFFGSYQSNKSILHHFMMENDTGSIQNAR